MATGGRVQAYEQSLDAQLHAITHSQSSETSPSKWPLGPALAGATAGGSQGSFYSETLPSSFASEHLLLSQAEAPTRSSSDIRRRLNQISQPQIGRLRGDKLFPIEAPRDLTIGILTSGGDGPGENAAIEALVRGVAKDFSDLSWSTLGIFEGFRGLLDPRGVILPLTLQDVMGKAAVLATLERIYGQQGYKRTKLPRSIASLGGNLLRSSRTNPVERDPDALQVKETLRRYGIDALVVLGGNGSLGASLDLHQQGVPLVFIPQTIDNDVPGSEVSLGFPSAVAQGISLVKNFYHTAHSCNRWFIVEVMGQRSGILALAIARKAGVEGVFVGEFPRPLSDISQIIERYRAQGQSHGVILVSESAQFLDDEDRQIQFPRREDANGRLEVEPGALAQWLSRQIGRDLTRPESLAYGLRGALPTESEIQLAQTLAYGALRLLYTQNFGHMSALTFENGVWKRAYPALAEVHGSHQGLGLAEYQLTLSDLGFTFH